MNLDNAIAAHSQWKVKFRSAIAREEMLDATTITKDNCCELGKWLYAEGKSQYGSRVSFVTLVAKHKAFHAEAGKVAAAICSKKFDDAHKMVEGVKSPFNIASSEVGVAINQLKKSMC